MRIKREADVIAMLRVAVPRRATRFPSLAPISRHTGWPDGASRRSVSDPHERLARLDLITGIHEALNNFAGHSKIEVALHLAQTVAWQLIVRMRSFGRTWAGHDDPPVAHACDSPAT